MYRYCVNCGSELEKECVACPRCGQMRETEFLEHPEPLLTSQKGGWYPAKRQWWVIWITAILVVIGLMNGQEGAMFAFCSALIGALVVWRLQDRNGGA